MENDYLLGTDEIAKRLGCNRNFVGDLINSGLLNALRFGRTRKVRNSTLNQFLQKYDGCNLHELVKKTPAKQRQVKMMGYIHYPMKGGGRSAKTSA